jgi:hypothetical protein
MRLRSGNHPEAPLDIWAPANLRFDGGDYKPGRRRNRLAGLRYRSRIPLIRQQYHIHAINAIQNSESCSKFEQLFSRRLPFLYYHFEGQAYFTGLPVNLDFLILSRQDPHLWPPLSMFQRLMGLTEQMDLMEQTKRSFVYNCNHNEQGAYSRIRTALST